MAHINAALFAVILSMATVVPVSTGQTEVAGRPQTVLNQKDEQLFRAAASGDIAAVKRLLDTGANVNAREEDETPLMYAAVEGHTEVVAHLISRGADINALSKNQETALGRAARVGRPQTVMMLISKGADIEKGGRHATTPLMAAASQGKTATVRILLENGAFVNAADDIGNTALMYAIIGSAPINTVKTLLDSGANVDIPNNDGMTPLMLARKRSNKQTVELLSSRLPNDSHRAPEEHDVYSSMRNGAALQRSAMGSHAFNVHAAPDGAGKIPGSQVYKHFALFRHARAQSAHTC